ncbi:MAG: sulfatase-like hydrolase/transferase [Anaerolineae bacterium]|nr:sulfatase-like hydrolase/transferase [Anaerolineae bacterium]
MSNRPNILIFMTDQEQGAVVDPGHPCQTPNADRLASQGIRFRQTYTPYAHCCPSRASFMTGLYPSRHGVFNNVCTPTAIHTGLNPGITTFSELLRDAGYRLVYSGKWHVSNEEGPADRGWEELIVTAGKGCAYQHHRSVDQWREWAQRPEETGPRQRGQILRPGWGHYRLYGTIPDGGPKGYENLNDYAVVRAAVDILPELAQGDAPWVLFVGPLGPHDPFIVPERFASMYDPREVPLPPNYHDTLEDKPRVYQRMRRQYWSQLTEDEVRESIAHYWAYCTMEDAMLGEVLDALDATGQADNTLVIFMSDHGEYCGAHGLYMKGVPSFREAYHIPCVMRWPEGIRNPGRDVDDFITHVDFAPTFLELAGVPIPEEMAGRSLLPFLRDERPTDWRDTHYTQFNGVELYYTQRSVMTREFKYVYNGFDFDELYDLRNDPHEMVNVADRPEYQEIKRELVRKMWQFAAEQGDELIFNPYGTVALAPWGPMEGFRGAS